MKADLPGHFRKLAKLQGPPGVAFQKTHPMELKTSSDLCTLSVTVPTRELPGPAVEGGVEDSRLEIGVWIHDKVPSSNNVWVRAQGDLTGVSSWRLMLGQAA